MHFAINQATHFKCSLLFLSTNKVEYRVNSVVGIVCYSVAFKIIQNMQYAMLSENLLNSSSFLIRNSSSLR